MAYSTKFDRIMTKQNKNGVEAKFAMILRIGATA